MFQNAIVVCVAMRPTAAPYPDGPLHRRLKMPGQAFSVPGGGGRQSFGAVAVGFASAFTIAICTARPSHTRPDSVGMARSKAPGQRQLLPPHTIKPSCSYHTHRGEGSANLRRQIKTCKSEKQLRQHAASAEDKGAFDTSVLAASVQKCGYSLWWDMLLDILETGKRLCVPFNTIALSALFKALVSCLQAYHLSKEELSERAAVAFKIAMPMFDKFPAETELEFNALLASAERLLDEIGTVEALECADRLWKRADNSTFSKTIVAYTVRLRFLERHGKHEEVDSILERQGAFAKRRCPGRFDQCHGAKQVLEASGQALEVFG